MLKIVADNKIPYLKGVLEPYAEMHYLPAADIAPANVQDADALITRTRTPCNASLLEGSRVKFIASATIGFDHIDQEYCNHAGIQWTNAPGCNAGSVYQYMAALLAQMAKRHKLDLSRYTLGVIGAGNVGSKVAGLGALLGMRVLLNDPPRERNEGPGGFASLETLKKQADILTFHVPLNKSGQDQTRHLADEVFFRQIKPTAVVINTSRGAVVDNQALKKALQQNQTAGAALDVWEHEPDIDRELLHMVIAGTPHIAGYSRDGKANGTSMAVHAISRFFGLGLEDWYPQVEPPANPEICIDANQQSLQQVMQEAILATYNLQEDTHRLRQSPETFEKQRGDYPVRREFQAYTVHLNNGNDKQKNHLQKLGFQVKGMQAR